MSKGRLEAFSDGVPLAFANRWVALAIYVGVAAMWLVPDRRFEGALR